MSLKVPASGEGIDLKQVSEKLDRERREREEEDREARQRNLNYIAITISMAAALFTGIAAVFTGLQFDEARQSRIESAEAFKLQRNDFERQLGLQSDTARTSSEHAKRSAAAAEASADVAKQALHISERAYVDVTILVDNPIQAGEEIRFKVHLKNVGKTPAVEMMGRATMASAKSEAEAFDKIAEKWTQGSASGTPSRVVLGPGARIDLMLRGPVPLSQAELEEIQEGRTSIYVGTLVVYMDVFGHAHRSQFCGRYNSKDKAVEVCSRFNTSD